MNFEELSEILTDKIFNGDIELEDPTETQRKIKIEIKNYVESYYKSSEVSN